MLQRKSFLPPRLVWWSSGSSWLISCSRHSVKFIKSFSSTHWGNTRADRTIARVSCHAISMRRAFPSSFVGNKQLQYSKTTSSCRALQMLAGFLLPSSVDAGWAHHVWAPGIWSIFLLYLKCIPSCGCSLCSVVKWLCLITTEVLMRPNETRGWYK